MPRRRPVEINVHHERWLVSYSDFITLLFAFFVVMYSISQVNESKYRVLSETLVDAFNDQKPSSVTPIQVGDPSRSVDPSAIHLVTDDNKDKGKGPEKGDGPFDKTADLPQLSDMFQDEFSDLISDDLVQLHSNEFWLEVEMSSSILFASADAEPSLQAESVFADVAAMLKPYNNPIQVEGFTDNVPINSVRYPSNWELSAARAASAVKLLVKGGVDASRLSAVGYGEHQPVADNATPEGRAKNRRVVLMIARERVERPNVGSAEELGRAVNPVEVTVESPYPEPGEGQAPISETAATTLTDALDDLNADSEELQDRLAPIGEIKPVETKQGGLLFSSDPELQRN